MPTQTQKSQLGAKNKQDRTQVKNILATLKGKDISKLTAKEQADLLTAISILLGLADKSGVLK